MPIRKVEELCQPELTSEEVEVLSSPRLLWVNDSILAEHFPSPWVSNKCSVKNQASARTLRRQFLLENARVVASSFAKKNPVVRDVSKTGEKRQAARPPRYGRGLITRAYPVCVSSGMRLTSEESCGLLDLKGVGVAPDVKPRISYHGTGTLQLSCAIQELVNQFVVEQIMRCAGVSVQGVPVYGILDLGVVGIDKGRNRFTPCATLVRAGHRRPRGGIDLPQFGSSDHVAQVNIEAILQQHGMTSSGSNASFVIEREEENIYKAYYAGELVKFASSEHIAMLLQQVGIVVPQGVRMSFPACNVQLTDGCAVSPLAAHIIDFFQYRPQEGQRAPLLSLVRDRPFNWGGLLSPESCCANKAASTCCINHRLLKRRELRKPLSDWVGLTEGSYVNGAEYFGMELAMKVDHEKLSIEEFSSCLDKFLDSIITPSRKNVSDSSCIGCKPIDKTLNVVHQKLDQKSEIDLLSNIINKNNRVKSLESSEYGK